MKSLRTAVSLIIIVTMLVGCVRIDNDFEVEIPIKKVVDESGGVLENDSLKVIIPEDALEVNQEITIEEGKGFEKPKKSEGVLLSAPIHIVCEQEISRFNQPIVIEMALTEEDLQQIEELGDIYGAYYNGEEWQYVHPLEVDLEEGYFTFETYHFSWFSKGIPSEEKLIEEFASKTAVAEWSKSNEKSAVVVQTENLVKDIMKNQLGIVDDTLSKDIITAIMNENEFGNLMSSYDNNDMDSFTQGLAVMTGKKIIETIDDQSRKSTKALLGKITENASKIGTGVTMVTAIAEGDMEGAAKALSMEIVDAYPVTKLFKTAAEITDRQIKRWKDDEIEAAFQAYKNGSEKKVLFWGYNVEKGDFEEVWTQMRGVQTKVYSDALKDYAANHDISVDEINQDTQNMIRSEAKNKLEEAFKERESKEKDIAAIEKDHIKLLTAFKKANLFKKDIFGYTEDTTFEFRLERLYKIKDMILRDTGASIDHSDSIRKKEISHETVAKLARLWYSSDDGKAKYREQLVELGFVKGDEKANVENGTKAYLRFEYLTDGSHSVYHEPLVAEYVPVLLLGDIPVVIDEDGLFTFEKTIGPGQYLVTEDYIWDDPQNVNFSGFSVSGAYGGYEEKNGEVKPFTMSEYVEGGEGLNYYSYTCVREVKNMYVRVWAQEVIDDKRVFEIQYLAEGDIDNITWVTMRKDPDDPDKLIRDVDESTQERYTTNVTAVYTLIVE